MQGGSFLIKLTRTNKEKKIIKNLIRKENNNLLFKDKTKLLVNKKINLSLKHVKNTIKKINRKKINLSGYGASAKCVMLINLLNLNNQDLNFVVDNTKYKQNKLIPGTNIPIIAPKKTRDYLGKYCILFSWNFAKEIIQKEKNKNKNTKWLLPIPKVKVIK